MVYTYECQKLSHHVVLQIRRDALAYSKFYKV